MANLFNITVTESGTARGTARIKTDSAAYGGWYVWQWLTGDWYDSLNAESLDMTGSLMLTVNHEFFIPFCPLEIATASSPLPTTMMNLKFFGGGVSPGLNNAEINWRGNVINTSRHIVIVQITIA